MTCAKIWHIAALNRDQLGCEVQARMALARKFERLPQQDRGRWKCP